MLRDFVEKKHYIFVDKAADWEEAIRIGCKPLEADETVDGGYAQKIIDCVHTYGPYIVLMPGVAMPHLQENAAGVKRTSIGFMKVEEPVWFDPEDEDKYATIFFTLASCNHEEHLVNMQKLAEMLMNEELVEALKKAGKPEDLIAIQEKYLD